MLLLKKVENHSDRLAASFTYNDLVVQDEERAAAIKWTAIADFQLSRGRVLTELS